LISRLGKTLLVATLAVYFLLVSVNNITDYQTNFKFVKHVLSMDSVPFDLHIGWRAIHSHILYHLAYWLIIVWEFGAGIFCAVGTKRLLGALRSERRFERAKSLPLAGLWLGILLWSFAFITVGGEWFLMWESVWSGESAAFRMFTLNAAALFFLYLPDVNSGAAAPEE
jgi:predicted small integral membrane protein